MKLEGSLETIPLRELIDMVVYSSVTGSLNIYGSGEPGSIYFRDGVLYHVERGSTHGIDALAQLLEWTGASFTFVSGIAVDAESLWGSLNHNLQSAERLAVRWRQIRAYVPSLELVPSLLVAREGLTRHVSPSHYPMLAVIDGRASIREIAANLGWAEVDAAEAIAQLAVDGLVEVRSARVSIGEGAEAAAKVAPEYGGVGVFDRLLGRSAGAVRPVEPAEEPFQLAGESRGQEEHILRLLRG